MNICLFCDRELELVENNPFQPYEGGEVNFIFAYGSRFDLHFDTTEYSGIICDDCAEKFLEKMERTQ